MKKIGLLLIVLSLQIPLLTAQQSLDLKTALRYAIDHHSSIQKATIDIQKGQQLVRESLSTGLPQVSASGNIVNNLAIPTSFVPAEFFGGQPGEFAQVQFGTNWNAVAGIQLEQKAFDKAWLLGLKATMELSEFYKLMLEKSKEDVVYEVAKLYYQIQLSRTQRGILSANLGQIEGLLTVTQKQFDNGFAKKIDVDRLKVQQANLQTQLTNLDLQVRQAEQALKFAMQMPLDSDIILTDTISEAAFQEVDPTVIQPTWQQKTDLAILKKQQQLYSLDERRWKSGYFPTLSLFANYNYQWQANNLGEFGTGRNWTDFSAIGLRLNVPIFDGFFKDSKIQTARLNSLQIGQDHRMASLGLQLQHDAAVTSLRTNQNTLNSVRENRQVAEEVYRVSQSRFKEGIAPITELLDAESSMRQAQANYITTLAQIKLAEIDLLNVNGQLIKMAE
jgi:outer membrane protein